MRKTSEFHNTYTSGPSGDSGSGQGLTDTGLPTVADTLAGMEEDNRRMRSGYSQSSALPPPFHPENPDPRLRQDVGHVPGFSLNPALEGTPHHGQSERAYAAWQALAAKYPNLKINSSHRDPGHNTKVGGAKGSQHLSGNAYDLNWAHMTQGEKIRFLQIAQDYFSGFGIYPNAAHVDVGPRRMWGPSYKYASSPQWARNALGM